MTSLLLAGWSGTAFGQPQAAGRQADEIAVRLDFRSPSSCGTEEELARRVRVRSERIRFVRTDGTRNLQATIIRRGGRYVATLSLVQPNGKRSSRRIQASVCDEALDALALVAAVMLDPTAVLVETPPPERGETPRPGTTAPDETRPTPAPATPGTTPAPKPAPSSPDPAKPATETEKLEPEPPPLEKPELETVPAKPDDEPDETPDDDGQGGQTGTGIRSGTRRIIGSIGASLQANSGPAPAVLPGGAIFAGVEWNRGAELSPFVRVTGAHFERSGFEADGGEASFTLNTLSVELCPIRFGAGPIVARPCALGTTGRLGAKGSQTVSEDSVTRPWWLIGVSGLLAAHPTRLVEVSLEASAGHPLIRDAFQFRPVRFHLVPNFTFTAGVGLAVRFP